jgi:hypothetical protein
VLRLRRRRLPHSHSSPPASIARTPQKHLPVAYSYSTSHDSSAYPAAYYSACPAYRSLRRAAPVRAWLCTRSGSGTISVVAVPNHPVPSLLRIPICCRLQRAGYVSVPASAVRVRSPECNVRGSRASGRMDGREGAGRWIWYGRARWGNSGGCVL